MVKYNVVMVEVVGVPGGFTACMGMVILSQDS
jgi:hypothetical protein